MTDVSSIELVALKEIIEDGIIKSNEKNKEVIDDEATTEQSTDGDDDDTTTRGRPPRATFIALLCNNRPFRLYFISCIVSGIGEWFTYIAAITIIEDLTASRGEKMARTAVGILVVVRIVPSLLLMSVGGVLADSRDRRETMIILDMTAAIAVLFYIAAYEMKSLVGIYITAFLQECIAALYEPSSSSIIPLLVPEEDYLEKATTLSGLVWSFVATFGSSLGGFALASLGIHSCFLLDSLTYLVGAYLMWRVGGTWNVAATTITNINDEDTQPSQSSAWAQLVSMTVDGAKYLSKASFGTWVFIKASSGFLFGATDLLNVSFSDHVKDGHSSERLGLLFAFSGIGCLCATLVTAGTTDMSKPSTLQLACIIALIVETLGLLGMATFSPFWSVCAMNVVESTGSTALWINADLLFQKLTAPEMLGRVVAVEYFLFTLTEAISALFCGFLQDQVLLSPRETSLVFALVGSCLVLGWVCYHCCKPVVDVVEEQQEYTKLEQNVLENDPTISA